MKLISYAQSFEDVILWRALQSVPSGFYIDVGANDPTIDSVTKTFYEAGWSGINIEPLKSHYDDLVKDRPRDINLCEAAGNVSTTLEIWDLGVRGWGTLDKEVAERHIACGHQATSYTVPVRPLTEICEEHCHTEVHFLKIDVEGFEHQVIEGLDLNRFRPWIIVIEATMPNSKDESHDKWEHLLTDREYTVVYTDGLNRYYLANEKKELAHHFKYPPNVFDEFILNSEFQALKSLETASQTAAERLEKLEAAETRIRSLENTLDTILNSRSWLITKPLRAVTTFLKSRSDKHEEV